MVFSKKKDKMLQKLVGVMIIENIPIKLGCIVLSTVAHECDTILNMALHCFRLYYAESFAKERF